MTEDIVQPTQRVNYNSAGKFYTLDGKRMGNTATEAFAIIRGLREDLANGCCYKEDVRT